MSILSDYYLIIKSFHIISIIAWMAGLLYLPRLFVYHASTEIGSELSETLKKMEYRLLRYIMNPAMVSSLFFGVLLSLTPGIIDWSAWWVFAKILALLLLVVVHLNFSSWQKIFYTDLNRRSAKFYRISNEVPTLLMIGIVFLVIIKPGQ